MLEVDALQPSIFLGVLHVGPWSLKVARLCNLFGVLGLRIQAMDFWVVVSRSYSGSLWIFAEKRTPQWFLPGPSLLPWRTGNVCRHGSEWFEHVRTNSKHPKPNARLMWRFWLGTLAAQSQSEVVEVLVHCKLFEIGTCWPRWISTNLRSCSCQFVAPTMFSAKVSLFGVNRWWPCCRCHGAYSHCLKFTRVSCVFHVASILTLKISGFQVVLRTRQAEPIGPWPHGPGPQNKRVRKKGSTCGRCTRYTGISYTGIWQLGWEPSPNGMIDFMYCLISIYAPNDG